MLCVSVYVCVYNIYVLEEQDAATTRVYGFKKALWKTRGSHFEKVTRKVKEQSWCTLSRLHDARSFPMLFLFLFFFCSCFIVVSATIRLRRSRGLLAEVSFSFFFYVHLVRVKCKRILDSRIVLTGWLSSTAGFKDFAFHHFSRTCTVCLTQYR